MDFKAVKIHCANLHGSQISMRRRQPALHSIGDHPRCFGEPNMQVDSNIILDPRTTLAILQHVSTAVCDQLYPQSCRLWRLGESSLHRVQPKGEWQSMSAHKYCSPVYLLPSISLKETASISKSLQVIGMIVTLNELNLSNSRPLSRDRMSAFVDINFTAAAFK